MEYNTLSSKTKRIRELNEILQKASYAYYGLDNPIMSDKEYDDLYDELSKLENETDGTVVNLGELSKEKINMLVQMIMDMKDSMIENKKDNKDITDELIYEEKNNDLNK